MVNDFAANSAKAGIHLFKTRSINKLDAIALVYTVLKLL